MRAAGECPWGGAQERAPFSTYLFSHHIIIRRVEDSSD